MGSDDSAAPPRGRETPPNNPEALIADSEIVSTTAMFDVRAISGRLVWGICPGGEPARDDETTVVDRGSSTDSFFEVGMGCCGTVDLSNNSYSCC